MKESLAKTLYGLVMPKEFVPCEDDDWWAFGEHRYGDRKALVESEAWNGPAFQTCKNAATICRAFETSRRREVLPFRHHTELASLPPDEADALLDWCQAPLQRGAKNPKTINLAFFALSGRLALLHLFVCLLQRRKSSRMLRLKEFSRYARINLSVTDELSEVYSPVGQRSTCLPPLA